MMRLLIAVLGMLAASAAVSADFKGDAVDLCGTDRQPAAALRPSLFDADVKSNPSVAYFRLRHAATQVLAGTSGPADRFLALLRNPGARVFSVAPDGDTEKLFRGAPADTITISCAGGSVPQSLVDIAAAALIAERIRVAARLDLEKIRADAVTDTSQKAEALLKNGLAMWPWELWANGLRLSERDSDRLFRTQLILMRPTAGIEIDTHNRASADLHASVMLEPFGFVRYRGNSYSSWWGASFVVTSSTGRGAGVGGLFRWDNYTIGLTRHKGDGTRPDSTFLMIGVDLYDALNKKRAQLDDWEGFRKLRDAMK